MAKQENFDFETDKKFNLDLNFFKNLTQKQKETILMIAIAVVAVIVIVVIGVIVLTGGNGGGNNGGGINTPGNNDSSIGDNNTGEEDGNTEDDGNGEVPSEISVFGISSPPTKVEYYVGEELDCDGLYLYYNEANYEPQYVYYNDDPNSFTITGFDSSAPVDEQVITVECRGLTDVFIVKIKEKAVVEATLVGITLKSLPVTEYYLGDAFDPYGGVILAEYSDGSTVEIELQKSHISGFNSIETAGEHILKVMYFDDHGGYAETTFTITMTE